jgi:hypothetical protein
VEEVNAKKISLGTFRMNVPYLSGCSVYDDLMPGRGQETPENHPLIVVRGFFYRLVEAVEKVPKQILGRDAETNDLTECATINDLILGRGQVTPENIVLTGQKDFSYRLVMHKNSDRAWILSFS